MSIFIKIDILKPFLIQHFKKKISTFINIEQKCENYAIYIKTLKTKLNKEELRWLRKMFQ